MPKTHLIEARQDADRAVVVAILKALKARIGHDPDRHTTIPEFHAAIARDIRARVNAGA